jgi:cytochrome c biogenesis factor
MLLVDLRRRDAGQRDVYAMRWPVASRVVVAIAAIITAVGIGGGALRQGTQVHLETAGTTKITDWFGDQWMLTSEGFSRYTVLNRNVTALGLHVELNGKRKGILTTEIRHYFDSRGSPLPRISVQSDVKSSWKQDLHVFLTSYGDTGRAGLIVLFNPFAKWIWVGGTLLALCGLWFFWPSARERYA